MRLHEGQFSTVARSMSFLTRAETSLDSMLGALELCDLSIDKESIRAIKYHMDKAHQDLQGKILKHLDVIEGKTA